MMKQELQYKGFHWLDISRPNETVIDELIQKYGFHELDKATILDDDLTAHVETYESYLFIVLHFPKYESRSKRYIVNELTIFLTQEYIISIHSFDSQTLTNLFSKYEKQSQDTQDQTTASILFAIIDGMLDKAFRTIDNFTRDLRTLEKQIFHASGEELIREIMIKKRNVIVLKHMLKPQISALKILELRINSLFNHSMEIYFENLQDKIESIFSEIELIQENLDSMEDTLKSIFEMKTNTTIKYLTFFSAFMLPLTLITSFFGMNTETVPFPDIWVYGSLFGTFFILTIAIGILLKKGKI